MAFTILIPDGDEPRAVGIIQADAEIQTTVAAPSDRQSRIVNPTAQDAKNAAAFTAAIFKALFSR